MKQRVSALQDYEPYFYPLDAVLKWNRMYGKRGLLQFQYAIPWEHAREGTIAILREVAKSGLASFLAVLKAFGDVPSPGMMSFPKPGITFALDFPIKPDKSFALFERLADMTSSSAAASIPPRTHAMTPLQFQAFYPQWQRFARYKDPVLTSSFWERVDRRTGDHVDEHNSREPIRRCATVAIAQARAYRTAKRILVLGATSGIAEACMPHLGASAATALSRRAQCGQTRCRRR